MSIIKTPQPLQITEFLIYLKSSCLRFFHPAASIDSVGMYNLLGKLLKSVTK